MGSKSSRKGNRANRPPDGIAWIWHTVELVSSAAWRTRSINCRRFIDFLELEHMKHGGVENGELLAPYSQLVSFGIGRRLIAGVIRESERRGLVRVDRGGKKGHSVTELSRYTLTYQWSRTITGGLWDWFEPTDNWKAYSEPEIGSPSCTGTVHLRIPVPVHFRALPPLQAVENIRTDVVHLRVPPSKSWGGDQPSTAFPPDGDRESAAAAHATQAASARPDNQIKPTRAPARALNNVSEIEGLKPPRDILDLSKLVPNPNWPLTEAAA